MSLGALGNGWCRVLSFSEDPLAREFVCTAVFTRKLLAQLRTGGGKIKEDSKLVCIYSGWVMFGSQQLLLAQRQSPSINMHIRDDVIIPSTPLVNTSCFFSVSEGLSSSFL